MITATTKNTMMRVTNTPSVKAGIDAVHKAPMRETVIPAVVEAQVRFKSPAYHVSNLCRKVSSGTIKWLISGGAHNTVCIKCDEAEDVESRLTGSARLDDSSVIEAFSSDLSVMSSIKRRRRRSGGG